MLPSVTRSGRNAIVVTVSNLSPAHCAAVGRNVPGAAFADSAVCSAIGLTSFGTTARPSRTSATATATIASCHHRERACRAAPAILVAVAGTVGCALAGDAEAFGAWSGAVFDGGS